MLPYTKGETNFLKYVLTHPCGTQWMLFVETFAEASLFLALGLTVPSLQDILSDESRGLLAGRAPHRHRFNAGELYEEGKELTPSARRFYKFAKGAAWLLDGLEFIGFWWSIVAGLDEFFYQWHSMLVERQWCSEAVETGPFARRDANFPVNFNATHNAIALSNLIDNRGGWPNTQFGVDVPAGFFTVLLMGEFSGLAGNDLTDCYMFIAYTTGGGTVYTLSEQFTIPAGGSAAVAVHDDYWVQSAAGANFAWGILSPSHAIGLAQCVQADVFVRRSRLF